MNLTLTSYKKPLLLVLLSSSLVACGGGNDSGEYNYKDNFVISINEFTFDVYKKHVVAIKRDISKIRDGSLLKGSKPLYTAPEFSIGKPNKKDGRYFIGTDFTRILTNKQHPAASYDVTSNRAYQDKWKDDKTGKVVNTIKYQYIQVNIEGLVTRLQNGLIANNKAGAIQTTLNVLPKTKSIPIAFPKGSRCDVLARNIENAYFEFSDSDVIADSDKEDKQQQIISEWKNKHTNHVEAKYGTNADITAFYVTKSSDSKDKKDSQKYDNNYQQKALVVYGNKLYTATYNEAGKHVPNYDKRQGVVKCSAYNDISADFMEVIIKTAYK